MAVGGKGGVTSIYNSKERPEMLTNSLPCTIPTVNNYLVQLVSSAEVGTLGEFFPRRECGKVERVALS